MSQKQEPEKELSQREKKFLKKIENGGFNSSKFNQSILHQTSQEISSTMKKAEKEVEDQKKAFEKVNEIMSKILKENHDIHAKTGEATLVVRRTHARPAVISKTDSDPDTIMSKKPIKTNEMKHLTLLKNKKLSQEDQDAIRAIATTIRKMNPNQTIESKVHDVALKPKQPSR